MKKLFSFLLIVVLIACSKDPVIYTLTATANPAEGGSVSPSSQQYDSGDVASVTATPRSEERRVGKECRSRWSPYH